MTQTPTKTTDIREKKDRQELDTSRRTTTREIHSFVHSFRVRTWPCGPRRRGEGQRHPFSNTHAPLFDIHENSCIKKIKKRRRPRANSKSLSPLPQPHTTHHVHNPYTYVDCSNANKTKPFARRRRHRPTYPR
ncbi:unnamed protein product [Ectocarpus sp. 4 AP-2014]